jgi:hypothetical protein
MQHGATRRTHTRISGAGLRTGWRLSQTQGTRAAPRPLAIRCPPPHRCYPQAIGAPWASLAFVSATAGLAGGTLLLCAVRSPPGRCSRKFTFPPRMHVTFRRPTARDVVSDRSSLEGGLLFIAEPETALQVRKGALCVRYQDGKERTFPRGRHRLRSIMLSSPGANVTIEAMRFAIDEGITIFVMHRAGEALAVLTNAPTVNTSAYALELRRAQFASTSDRRSRGRF